MGQMKRNGGDLDVGGKRQMKGEEVGIRKNMNKEEVDTEKIGKRKKGDRRKNDRRWGNSHLKIDGQSERTKKQTDRCDANSYEQKNT